MGEFGDKFRQAREKKNLTLDDVSNVTKISARMLQAIEAEKFDQLPGGVFNKGFIRAYARHLGLNDEEAVTEYLACLRQAQIAAQAVWEPPARVSVPAKKMVAPSSRREVKAPSPTQVEELPELQLPRAEDVRPPRRPYRSGDIDIPWRLVAVAMVVVILAAVLWRRHTRNATAEIAVQPAVQAAQPSSDAATIPQPQGASTPLNEGVVAKNSAPANQPARPATKAATNSASGNPSTGNTSSGNPASANPAPSKATSGPSSSGASQQPGIPAGDSQRPAATSPAKNPAGNGENDVTTQPVATTEPASKTMPLTLVIRASENSWISVTADGQAISHETLIAPANTSIRARREIVAKVGNAAGVSFLWNGKEIPADGAEAEVKTFVFDADGMRVLTPNQPQSQSPTPNP